MSIITAHDPLHDPDRDARDWSPGRDLAIDLARQTLAKHATANIHDHTAMLQAATGLDYVLRDLIAALDAERGQA